MSKRSPAQQLSLTLSVEASADLQHQLEQCERTVQDLAAEHAALRAALQAAQAQALDLERQLIYAQTLVRTRELQLALLTRLDVSPPQSGLARDHLTALLALAHPDKWAQGQPATELAHELSVVITKLRAQGER
jgi:hypothetical protein